MQAIKVKEAKTAWEKSKGLLGTSKPYPLLLKTRWGIHTFGMKYPIDVVILDNSNRIVKLRPNLKPNRIFLWNPKYNTVLELPKDSIIKFHLNFGDHIEQEIIRD